MSLTIVLDRPKAVKIGKGTRMLSGNIAFDSAYVTGGESANGITRYFKSCKEILCDPKSGYIFSYDYANAKIKAMVPVSVEAGSATAGANNTLVVANSQVEIAGDGVAQQVAAVEVANAANLAELTDVRFVAYGY